jgi:hypothetical protein
VLKQIVNANLYFPVEIGEGKIIKDIYIDENGKISYEVFEKIVLKGLAPSPTAFKEIAKENEKSRYINIFKIVEGDNYYNNLQLAISEIENLVSWLSFITLEDFRIISWGPIQDVTDNTTIKTGYKFNLPHDNLPEPLVDERDPIVQIYKIESKVMPNLDKYININLSDQVKSILRWYRKGYLSRFPEEKLIFWVTALEGVSGAIQVDGKREENCKNCGGVVEIRDSANKTALLQFIRDLDSNYSRNKIYEPIWNARSKYVHAANPKFDYFSEEMGLVLKATESLLIAFLSYYLLVSKAVPFKVNEIKYFNHPFIGDISSFKTNIDNFISSGTYKMYLK